MQASEGSFMGSDGADRPSERPRQGTEETPFLCYLSPAPFAVILAKTSPYKRIGCRFSSLQICSFKLILSR